MLLYSAYDFKLNPVSELFVLKELSKMKANKAIGIDKISDRLLGEAAGIIAPPLTYIINSSLKLGKFPSHWSLPSSNKETERIWITIGQYPYF